MDATSPDAKTTYGYSSGQRGLVEWNGTEWPVVSKTNEFRMRVGFLFPRNCPKFQRTVYCVVRL